MYIIKLRLYLLRVKLLLLSTPVYSGTSLKTLRIKDTIHLHDLSIKDKFCGPYRPWQYNFTSERGKPLYNSKIIAKIAAWSRSVRYLEVPR